MTQNIFKVLSSEMKRRKGRRKEGVREGEIYVCVFVLVCVYYILDIYLDINGIDI